MSAHTYREQWTDDSPERYLHISMIELVSTPFVPRELYTFRQVPHNCPPCKPDKVAMDLSTFIIGREIQVQFSVSKDRSTSYLKWYDAVIKGIWRRDNGDVVILLQYPASPNFKECCETYTLLDSQTLQQGKQRYPFRYSTGSIIQPENNVVTTHSSEPVHGDANNLVIINNRLNELEALLSASTHKVYNNVCSLLNTALQDYMKRVKKPDRSCSELVQSTWLMDMDCNFQDFKQFAIHMERTMGDRCSLPPGINRNGYSGWSIDVLDMYDLAKFFAIPPPKLNKLLVVKRCDRRGSILSFKTIGTIIQTENPSQPKILSIGGKADVWTTLRLFFHREHGHRTEEGLFTTSFTRIRRAEEHAHDMTKLENVTCPSICVKWVPNATDNVCTVRESDSLTMGKLVVQIPVITFHDMTIARKVNACISNQSDGMESDSSSTSH